jgi:hypothetical protein
VQKIGSVSFARSRIPDFRDEIFGATDEIVVTDYKLEIEQNFKENPFVIKVEECICLVW